jgi:hypothetical protein
MIQVPMKIRMQPAGSHGDARKSWFGKHPEYAGILRQVGGENSKDKSRNQFQGNIMSFELGTIAKPPGCCLLPNWSHLH